MKSTERRKQLLQMLRGRTEYLNATQMAEVVGVSRQIIVSDIALLRAEGARILSTPRGYLLEEEIPQGYEGTVVCRHTEEDILTELYCVVDNGGVVLDVSVEHQLYGLISATMNVRSRFDANHFVEKLQAMHAKPLSSLTEEIHSHRIRTQQQEDFQRIVKELDTFGLLVSP